MSRAARGLALALTVAATATPLRAQERPGPVVLRVPASAWAAGLGGAFTAARGTSDVLFHNPANLTVGGGASATLGRWGSASTAASLSHALTVNGWGIGIGARFLDYGAASARPAMPAELTERGPLLASSLSATVGVSRVVKKFRAGVAAKYAEERRPDEREGFGALDLGLGRDVGWFALGLAVRDVGAEGELGGEALRPPTRATVGAQLRQRPVSVFFDATAVAELSVDREGRVEGAGGGELIWVPLEGWEIAARAGLRNVDRAGDRGLRPYTGGLGISLDRFSLDYAFTPCRTGCAAHLFGVRLR